MDKFPNRKSIRLKKYDYSLPGYYFITFCTHNRKKLFGDIYGNEMHLNEYGRIVCDEWEKSFIIRPELLSDESIVMPNHFHGIVKIVSESATRPYSRAALQKQRGIIYRPPKSLSSFMAGFKSAVTKRINKMRNTSGERVLQYRYYDHIIRNEKELYCIRQYIKNNPNY